MTPTSARSQGSPWTDFVAAQAQVLSIAVFFLACFVIFSVTSEAFLTPGNLLNMLRQSAPMLIVAVAMTFVITTGGIDLSVDYDKVAELVDPPWRSSTPWRQSSCSSAFPGRSSWRCSF